jgi:hypothetical protein
MLWCDMIELALASILNYTIFAMQMNITPLPYLCLNTWFSEGDMFA